MRVRALVNEAEEGDGNAATTNASAKDRNTTNDTHEPSFFASFSRAHQSTPAPSPLSVAIVHRKSDELESERVWEGLRKHALQEVDDAVGRAGPSRRKWTRIEYDAEQLEKDNPLTLSAAAYAYRHPPPSAADVSFQIVTKPLRPWQSSFYPRSESALPSSAASDDYAEEQSLSQLPQFESTHFCPVSPTARSAVVPPSSSARSNSVSNPALVYSLSVPFIGSPAKSSGEQGGSSSVHPRFFDGAGMMWDVIPEPFHVKTSASLDSFEEDPQRVQQSLVHRFVVSQKAFRAGVADKGRRARWIIPVTGAVGAVQDASKAKWCEGEDSFGGEFVGSGPAVRVEAEEDVGLRGTIVWTRQALRNVWKTLSRICKDVKLGHLSICAEFDEEEDGSPRGHSRSNSISTGATVQLGDHLKVYCDLWRAMEVRTMLNDLGALGGCEGRKVLADAQLLLVDEEGSALVVA